MSGMDASGRLVATAGGPMDGDFHRRQLSLPFAPHSRMLSFISLVLMVKLVLVPWAQGSDGGEGQANPALVALYYLADFLMLLSCLAGIARAPLGKRHAGGILLICIVGWMLAVNFIVDISFTESLVAVLRWTAPLIFGHYLLGCAPDIPAGVAKRWAWILVCALVAMILAGLFLLPPTRENFEEFWPAYFNGQHTTCYLVVASGCCLWFLIDRAIRGNAAFAAKSLVFSLVVGSTYIGWATNTASICMMIFCVAYLMKWQWNRAMTCLYLLVVACIVLAAILSPDLVPDDAASGRIGVYRERLLILATRDLPDLFHGGGSGSDMLLTRVWWWAEKGSHNDFMTIVFEYGLVMLVLMVLFWRGIYAAASGSVTRGLLAAMLFSSMVSNGIMIRPLVAYVVLAFVFLLGKIEATHEPLLGTEPRLWSRGWHER